MNKRYSKTLSTYCDFINSNINFKKAFKGMTNSKETNVITFLYLYVHLHVYIAVIGEKPPAYDHIDNGWN